MQSMNAYKFAGNTLRIVLSSPEGCFFIHKRVQQFLLYFLVGLPRRWHENASRNPQRKIGRWDVEIIPEKYCDKEKAWAIRETVRQIRTKIKCTREINWKSKNAGKPESRGEQQCKQFDYK